MRKFASRPASPRGPRPGGPWLAGLCALGLAGAVGTAPALGAPPAERVGAAVVDALARGGTARVLVAFRADAAPGAPGRRGALERARNQVLASARPADIRVVRRFSTVAAVALEVNERALAALSRHPRVRRIDLDVGGGGSLDETRPLNGVDALYGLGVTGTGVRVAMLDSGIDGIHPDLGGALVDEACFCSGGGGCCHNGQATDSGSGSAQDDNGHGSSVAGALISDGFVSPRGVAPEAEIVAVKVLDSSASFCCSSDVAAGLDWVAANHPEVVAVNLSLGTNALFSGACDGATAYTMALADAVAGLRALGIPTVVSSGNNGSGTQMQAPACVEDAIAVGVAWDAAVGAQSHFGCVDLTTQADKVTCFSNTNATLDLVASANPLTTAELGANATNFFGTSAAAPVVAACVALLRQGHALTPAQVEAALAASPTAVIDAKNGLSFPRLDCQAALDFAAAALPALPPAGELALGALLASAGARLLLRRRR